jgi:AcrR family transcriptional regulator
MPRAGLSTGSVIEAAADLADDIGYDALTLTALATQLGVAVPSLYKHVSGLEALRQGVATIAFGELGDAIEAAVGPMDADADAHAAVRAVARAFRRYAGEHPGRYAATVRAVTSDDRQAAQAERVLGVVLELLSRIGLQGDEAVHGARALRAALHGFVSLEAAGGFGIPLDIGTSFDRMVDVLVTGLEDERRIGHTRTSVEEVVHVGQVRVAHGVQRP